MNILFCTDRAMLPALHVAAMQVLKYITGRPEFSILSEDLAESDLALLRKTLDSVGKPFGLCLITVSSKPFANFPRLTGSLTAYFRLLIPDLIEAAKCLYLDCDTFCQVDLSLLFDWDLDACPVGMCAESPIHGNADVRVAKELGSRAVGHYYNSGVMLFANPLWKTEHISRQCMEYVSRQQPDYHEQSAINFVLHEQIADLPNNFNCYTNVRANWPFFKSPQKGSGQFLHFVDFPKPWSRYGRWVHPFGKLWWQAYQETAHSHVGIKGNSTMKWSQKVKAGYKKSLKDKILFYLYEKNLKVPKGVKIT
jgi:lipopolysaccharide biosynthesis glycosyltransferase